MEGAFNEYVVWGEGGFCLCYSGNMTTIFCRRIHDEIHDVTLSNFTEDSVCYAVHNLSFIFHSVFSPSPLMLIQGKYPEELRYA